MSYNMNREMGSLPEPKAPMNQYKETLRRQMAKSTRLDSYLEDKRKKSKKKKSRHKLEAAAEETDMESFKKDGRSSSSELRTKSVCSRSKSVGLDSDFDKRSVSSPRHKTVTFAQDRLVEPFQVQVHPADQKDTLRYEYDCGVSDKANCDKETTERVTNDSSRDHENKNCVSASEKVDMDSLREQNDTDENENKTNVTDSNYPKQTVFCEPDSDILQILQDTSDVKGAYKDSRSSIKTISSMVRGVKQDKTDTVAECRKMFREEIMRLRQETEDFRIMCLKQIEKQKKAVEKHRRRSLSQVTDRQSMTNETLPELESELQGLSQSMEYLQHKQIVLDKEADLLNREEDIEKKQKHLEDYEQEIQDVEIMLRHRKALCDRRQVALITLDEELNKLKHEIEETKDQMEKDGIDTTTASERAKQNWEMLRRNMMDKQNVLESTVQKYRSELASAASRMVGKDILIQKLQEQLKDQEDVLKVKDKKLKNLELKLELALTEIHNMESKFDLLRSNTNNNNITLDKLHLVRKCSQDSMILRDSSQDSGIGPRDLSPRNSQDSHNTSHDSPGSRHSFTGSPDSQLSVKSGNHNEVGSSSSIKSHLLFPEIPGTPMSQPSSSGLPLTTDGSYRPFNSVGAENDITHYPNNLVLGKQKLRSKDKIVRHSSASRKQSIANGNLTKLSMLKHVGDDMKSGACSVM
ncbi:lamin-like protein isoform X2 [Patella vulgata]|uniref:lamin-like protein isoform X2 n=1 Tax=Patella vulgata TaxID=6465 RepID=UPI00217FAA28|nr:lamin-like protein isoform X2 [Patella vulgata]